MQRPVRISQVFTTPAESLEIAIPLVTCRLTDLIGAGVSSVDFELDAAGSTDKVLVCQNLIDLSPDDEIREEENMREVME